MATITPTKTDSVLVLSHQAVTHPVTVVGSAIDCLTKRAAVISMYHAYIEDVADTNPGKFKVQIRPDAGDGSVDEHWITVVELPVVGTGGADDTDLDATEPVGETVLSVPATTGFLAENMLYIKDGSSVPNSEWAECQEVVAATSINLVDGLRVAKNNLDTIWNNAVKFVVALDLNAVESFRVVWSHEGATGANGHINALAITYDSESTA